MKRCLVCKTELVGKQRLYCSGYCKMKEYWRRRYGSGGMKTLDELFDVMNWFMANQKETLSQCENFGEVLVRLYGVDKRVSYDGERFELRD